MATVVAAGPAASAASPQLKISGTNTVQACMAPQRLMQHVGRLNPRLDARFRDLASLYHSHGQALELRWDYAFFQMLAETGNLTFSGEVSKEHNNFAAIRTPDGSGPERFADIATGVLAHLHHIRLYAGEPVPKPAARRTKQVEAFILKWSKDLKRPVRFDDMAGRWSPNNPNYAATIEAGLREYQAVHCGGEVAAAGDKGADSATPRQAARGADKGRNVQAPSAEARNQPAPATASANEPVRTASVATSASRLGMPANALTATMPNATPPPAAAPKTEPPAEPTSVGSAAATAAAGVQCKVWSASFGGEKSVLIRVNDGQITHFTALQVNAGREKDETTAYIAAYARGGKTVGEFASSDQAINKAFELCPKT